MRLGRKRACITAHCCNDCIQFKVCTVRARNTTSAVEDATSTRSNFCIVTLFFTCMQACIAMHTIIPAGKIQHARQYSPKATFAAVSSDVLQLGTQFTFKTSDSYIPRSKRSPPSQCQYLIGNFCYIRYEASGC